MISSLKKKAVMILLSITVIIAMTPMMAFATGETQVDAKDATALQSAISNSTAATTVKLMSDITGNIEVTAGKTVTIDLNGHKITGNGNGGTYDDHPTIRNSGTLTIIGSGAIGNNQSGQSAIFNTGTATLSGGTYTSTGWYVLRNEGTMTINDGVKVSQGNISATPVINGLTRNVVAAAGDKGIMTINGGDFSGYYNVVKNGDKKGNLTINGGNFTLKEGSSQSSKNVIKNYSDNCTVRINGGTFTNNSVKEIGNVLALGTNAVITSYTVTGGTYNADPSAYVTSGYIVSKGTSTWTVSPYIPPAPSTNTETTTDPNTGNTQVNTTTNADVTVDNSGTATVSIPTTDLDKIVNDTTTAEKTATDAGKTVETNIVINGNTSASSGATKTAVEIPAATADKIAGDTNAKVTVETSLGDITLDQKTLDKVADTSKGAGTVKIEIAKVDEKTLTDDQQKSIGENAVVVSLSIVTDNGKVTDFSGGTVTVSMPAPANATAENTVLVNVKDDGTIEIIPCKIVDGKIVATLSHFSYYALADKATIEKTIAAQKKAENAKTASAVKATKITNMKAKVSKGKVKLTWSKKGTSLTGYRIYKSTKSKTGYKRIKTVTTKTYTLSKGLKKGKTYYFKVRGYKIVDKAKVYTSYAKIKVIAK